jgi:hypothetical protein
MSKVKTPKILEDKLNRFVFIVDKVRYDLGLKIHNAGDVVELDDDQAKFIKKAFDEGSVYLAIVVGQVLKRLEASKVVEASKSADSKPSETISKPKK